MTVAYDLRLPSVLANPYPVFRELQDAEPVHPSTILGGWVLTRYADVKACLSDARLSSDRITPFVQYRAGRADVAAGRADVAAGRTDAPAIETLGRTLGLWAVFTDPPKHSTCARSRIARSRHARWSTCGLGSRRSWGS